MPRWRSITPLYRHPAANRQRISQGQGQQATETTPRRSALRPVVQENPRETHFFGPCWLQRCMSLSTTYGVVCREPDRRPPLPRGRACRAVERGRRARLVTVAALWRVGRVPAVTSRQHPHKPRNDYEGLAAQKQATTAHVFRHPSQTAEVPPSARDGE